MNIRSLVTSELLSIITAIKKAGGNCYLVGGCIRDVVLDITSKDIDIEVYNISHDDLVKVLEKFGKVNTVGKQFGVTKLTTESDDYDFAFPRRDNKVGVGYTGFTVEVDSNMSIEEAASRRDFTFNTLMYDVLNDELVDVFNGKQHLLEGKLVATSDKFAEDPLRVLRGMQFAGRFNLTVDDKTAKLMASLVGEYSALSVERVWEEWYKWATKSVIPSKGIQVLIDSQWLSLFPELSAMYGVPQEPKWHPEGEVLLHTMLVCDAMANICNREGITGEDKAVLMFACLCHDMAKPTTTVVVDGVIKSPGHEKAGEEPTRSFLSSIGCPNKIIDRVVPLVVRHLAHLSCQSGRAVRRLAEALYPSTIVELGWVIEADQSGRPPIPPHMPEECKAMLEIAKNCNCSSGKILPLVTGKHLISLGVKPSKQMGEYLSQLFEAQLDGKFNCVDDGINYFNNVVR